MYAFITIYKQCFTDFEIFTKKIVYKKNLSFREFSLLHIRKCRENMQNGKE